MLMLNKLKKAQIERIFLLTVLNSCIFVKLFLWYNIHCTTPNKQSELDIPEVIENMKVDLKRIKSISWITYLQLNIKTPVKGLITESL